MKKLLCFALMICLATIMLVGCGRQAEEAATTAAETSMEETTVEETTEEPTTTAVTTITTTTKATTTTKKTTTVPASYSAEREVTNADKEIFYEAMRNEGRNGGDIEFVSVATKGSTYRFTILRRGMMPGSGKSTVYVTISKPAGGKAKLLSEENA